MYIKKDAKLGYRFHKNGNEVPKDIGLLAFGGRIKKMDKGGKIDPPTENLNDVTRDPEINKPIDLSHLKFSEAFSTAKKAGVGAFMWNGTLQGTQTADEAVEINKMNPKNPALPQWVYQNEAGYQGTPIKKPIKQQIEEEEQIQTQTKPKVEKDIETSPIKNTLQGSASATKSKEESQEHIIPKKTRESSTFEDIMTSLYTAPSRTFNAMYEAAHTNKLLTPEGYKAQKGGYFQDIYSALNPSKEWYNEKATTESRLGQMITTPLEYVGGAVANKVLSKTTPVVAKLLANIKLKIPNITSKALENLANSKMIQGIAERANKVGEFTDDVAEATRIVFGGESRLQSQANKAFGSERLKATSEQKSLETWEKLMQQRMENAPSVNAASTDLQNQMRQLQASKSNYITNKRQKFLQTQDEQASAEAEKLIGNRQNRPIDNDAVTRAKVEIESEKRLAEREASNLKVLDDVKREIEAENLAKNRTLAESKAQIDNAVKQEAERRGLQEEYQKWLLKEEASNMFNKFQLKDQAESWFKAKKLKAFGGRLGLNVFPMGGQIPGVNLPQQNQEALSSDSQQVTNAGTHESGNDVPVMNEKGQPQAMVENGEVIKGDQVYSERTGHAQIMQPLEQAKGVLEKGLQDIIVKILGRPGKNRFEKAAIQREIQPLMGVIGLLDQAGQAAFAQQEAAKQQQIPQQQVPTDPNQLQGGMPQGKYGLKLYPWGGELTDEEIIAKRKKDLVTPLNPKNGMEKADAFNPFPQPRGINPQQKSQSKTDWNKVATQGADFLNTYGSDIFNTYLATNRPNVPTPIMAQPASLYADYNINPQLGEIDAQQSAANQAIDTNTANSNVAMARKLGMVSPLLGEKNKLYGQKYNTEEERRIQDRMNTQQVNAGNINQANAYNQNVYEDRLNTQSDLSSIAANVTNKGLMAQKEKRQEAADMEKAIINAIGESNDTGVIANLISMPSYQKILTGNPYARKTIRNILEKNGRSQDLLEFDRMFPNVD